MTNDALGAFWKVVVRHFPTAETGDLSRWSRFTLQVAVENAVEEWVNRQRQQATCVSYFLKEDKRAIFTAASYASQIVDFLRGLQQQSKGQPR